MLSQKLVFKKPKNFPLELKDSMISLKVPGESIHVTSPDPWSVSFIVITTTVSNRLRSYNFRS